MAQSKLNHFPAGFTDTLPPGTLDDHYGRERFQYETGGHREILAPFDHQFAFSVENLRIAPVRTGEIQADRRGLVRRLLHPQVTLQPWSVSLGETGILVIGEEDSVRNAYPRAKIERRNGCWLVKQEMKDVYRKSKTTVKGTASESIVDHRKEFQSKSLLTPTLRSTLETVGEVVYESDPREADRLVICIKTIHGSRTSAWDLQAVSPEASMDFIKHQENLGKIVQDVVHAAGKDHTHAFLETFPEKSQGGEEESEFLEIITAAENAHKATKRIQGSLDQGNAIPFIRTLVSWGQDHTLQALLTNGLKANIHGDGRVPHDINYQRKNMGLLWDKAVTRSTGGGVGVASDLTQRKNEIQSYVMNQTHRGLTENIARNLHTGDTGVLIYGGAHFASGTNDEQTPERTPMEEYLAFLPRTQVVVIEPHDFNTILEHFEKMDAMTKKLPRDQRVHLAQFEDGLRDCIMTLRSQLGAGNTDGYEKLSVMIRDIASIRTIILQGKTVLSTKSPQPPTTTPDISPQDTLFSSGDMSNLF